MPMPVPVPMSVPVLPPTHDRPYSLHLSHWALNTPPIGYQTTYPRVALTLTLLLVLTLTLTLTQKY